jgi:hypothetical protein
MKHRHPSTKFTLVYPWKSRTLPQIMEALEAHISNLEKAFDIKRIQ